MNRSRPWPSAAIIALLVAASYGYAYALQCLPRVPGPSWLVVATLNSLIAFISLLLWTPLSPLSSTLWERAIAWSLAPLVLIGTGILTLVFRQSPGSAAHSYSMMEVVGLCLWIPLIEEIIFRRLISDWIGARFDGVWSIYLSGLVFALAHTSPPLNPWPPLGPFFLGCICALVYRLSGRLFPAILLHSACNLSAILFATFAPGLLDQLGWLYQKL